MALPTPTVIAPVAGYIPAGLRRYVFAPTVANVAAPLIAEISAGQDLTNIVSQATGWSGTSNTLPMQNAGSRVEQQVPGMITYAASTLQFNMSKTGANDAVSLFNDGSDGVTSPTSGFMFIFYEGIKTGGRLRVFPVTVATNEQTPDIATLAFCTVTFSIVEPPSGFITVPTA